MAIKIAESALKRRVGRVSGNMFFLDLRGDFCFLAPVPTPMQAELSLCRAHRLFCWFCLAPAHLYFKPIPK